MTEIEGTNIVPLFKRYEDLVRDEEEILQQFTHEWEGAYSKFDLADATIRNDAPILAKFAAHEVDLAKSQMKRHRNTDGAKLEALSALINSLHAAVEKRNRRLYGHSALAKRSLRFAQAKWDRQHGPRGGAA